jgi:hypothetical protein
MIRNVGHFELCWKPLRRWKITMEATMVKGSQEARVFSRPSRGREQLGPPGSDGLAILENEWLET